MNAPHPTRHWHALDDGRILCEVCPRRCKLSEGERGHCHVRGRQHDSVVSTIYGRATGFCVNPVESAPLLHFLPGSATLSLGTSGCNLSCSFCQVWDAAQLEAIEDIAETVSPTAIAELASSRGCRSVAHTYNDPVVALEFVRDTARACRKRHIAVVAVTAGYVCPEARADLFGPLAAASVALKAFSESFYARECDGHLEPVLDTLRYLVHETEVWVEVNTVLIPGLNDSEVELNQMVSWLVEELGPDVPWHLRAFKPPPSHTHVPPTKRSTLERARTIARSRGLRHVYAASSLLPHGDDTVCHGCGSTVIERGGSHILRYELDDRGRCRTCDTACPGVFDGGPGGWGAGQVPVTLRPHGGWET